jgi:hypothetical protein
MTPMPHAMNPATRIKPCTSKDSRVAPTFAFTKP